MAFKDRISRCRPFNQNLAVGAILFCLPGIYTALTGLGAGGGQPSSAEVANKTNAILYGLFAFVALFGGSILNILRPRLSLMVGSIGYPLYVGGLWYYDDTGNSWFPLFGGAMLGLTAGSLWTAAAYIQFTYAEEKDKGLYISIQWTLKSIGAIVGSSISLGLNIDKIAPVGVSPAVYIAFIVIHSSAFFIALLFIVHPSKVVRNDGTHIAVFRQAKLWPELKGIVSVMTDRRYILLSPGQIVCEMALALISSVNSRYFNLRTRSINNFSYQSAQAVVPLLLMTILDSRHIASRQKRGLLGMSLMGALSIAACVGLIAWLNVYSSMPEGADWNDASWPGLLVVYILFGAIYAGYQMVVEYTLSSTTNDPATLARVAGMFKFYSALGMMISFVMAGEGASFLAQTVLQLVLYILGIAGVVIVFVYYVKDSNYFTEADVVVPVAYEEDKVHDIHSESPAAGSEDIDASPREIREIS